EDAGELVHGLAHGFFQRRAAAVVLSEKVFLHQVSDDLGIGFGGELVPSLSQLLLQLKIVLNDAVMNNDDLAGAVAVRMCIFFGRAAVCCPARVADAIGSIERLQPDGLFQVAQLAFGAAHLQAVTVARDGDTGRVVAAILQPPQPVNDDRDYLFAANVTNYSAHALKFLIPRPIDCTLVADSVTAWPHIINCIPETREQCAFFFTQVTSSSQGKQRGKREELLLPIVT